MEGVRADEVSEPEACLGVACRDEETAVACMECGAGLVIVGRVDVGDLKSCWRCGAWFAAVELASGRRYVRPSKSRVRQGV